MSSIPAHVAAFPKPISRQILEEMAGYVIFDPYPFALDLAKGHGMYLVTVDGDELFDWAGFYGSRLLGHNHPGLYNPDYVNRLVVAANNKTANPDFLTRECLAYYRLLHQNAPKVMQNDAVEVYAVNSGAEAVENMMKYMIARFNKKRHDQGRHPAYRRFLYFDKAFHGRTVFALGVTQTMDPIATKDFQGLGASGNIKLPFPSVGSLHSPEEAAEITERALQMVEMALSQMADEIVGIIIEPIQGAGGQRCALPEFFQGLAELAHQYDVYVGYDEVQTAGGVTGEMFAINHFDLPYPPIAVASGKKFGAGVLWMLEPLEDVGILDSTWGGTLADMVRVVREFEIVEEENLVALAAEKGAYLRDQLLALAKKHPKMIRNIRGMGLYQGFQLDTAARKKYFIQEALETHNTLLLGAGHLSLRFRPNLSVTKQDIDRLIEILDAIAKSAA
jgi:L-lysine 6-transaminase